MHVSAGRSLGTLAGLCLIPLVMAPEPAAPNQDAAGATGTAPRPSRGRTASG